MAFALQIVQKAPDRGVAFVGIDANGCSVKWRNQEERWMPPDACDPVPGQMR